MIAGLLLDLRHAVRLYLKTPWQSLLAILMLAAAMALVSTTAGLWSELNLSGTSGVIDDRGLVTIGRRGDMPMGTLSANGIVELERRSQTLRSVTGSSTMGGLYDIELDGRLVEGMASPVLPHGTMPSMPCSICRSINLSRASKSISPASLKGVINAVIAPSHMVFLVSSAGATVARRRAGFQCRTVV